MPKITEREFEKHIKDKEFKKLYFIYGEDAYSVVNIKNNLVDKIVEKKSNNFDYLELDGQNLSIDNLEMSLEQYPIMSKRKCVLIKNLDVDLLGSDELNKFYSVISDVPEYCSLIISQTSVKIDNKSSAKWKKALTIMEKEGLILNLSTKTKSSIEKQIIRWANAQNKELSFKNAELICSVCGSDLVRLKNEVDKLCHFEEDKEISEESIKKLVTGNLETNVFEMCKMLTRGKYAETIKFLHALLFQKEEPIAILSVISSVYIDMYRVKTAIESRATSSYIASIFDYKRKEFRLTSAERNSANLSMESIKKIIKILIEADLSLKSSRVSPELILELAVVKIIMMQNNR